MRPLANLSAHEKGSRQFVERMFITLSACLKPSPYAMDLDLARAKLNLELTNFLVLVRI